jgi:hypothetical protein
MAFRLWRFISMMSTAIAMSAAVAHLLELPAKMTYEPTLYVRLHRTLYDLFGKIAGPVEVVAVVATVALAWWMRRRHPDEFAVTAFAAAALVLAHGIYWIVVQPANIEMFRWSLTAVPQDWMRWRDRWEYGHAVRAILISVAMGALTFPSAKRS